MNKYIAFDCETGGLDPATTSLLTVYFAVLDQDLNIVDSLSLALKPNPDDQVYCLTAQALAINKINILSHNSEAIHFRDATSKLVDFLAKNSPGSARSKNSLIPLGHNVGFDLGFIQTQLLSKTIWERYVSYRLLDTATVAQFLLAAKILPESVSTSLDSQSKHYGLKFGEAGAHNAEADVKMTIAVLKAQMSGFGKAGFPK